MLHHCACLRVKPCRAGIEAVTAYEAGTGIVVDEHVAVARAAHRPIVYCRPTTIDHTDWRIEILYRHVGAADQGSSVSHQYTVVTDAAAT